MLQVYRGAVRQPGPGEGTVTRYSPKHGGWELQVGWLECVPGLTLTVQVEGVSMLLGGWWLQAAARGRLPTLPVTNTLPTHRTKIWRFTNNFLCFSRQIRMTLYCSQLMNVDPVAASAVDSVVNPSSGLLEASPARSTRSAVSSASAASSVSHN